MVDRVKISQLLAATALANTDIMPVVQSGATKKAALSLLGPAIAGDIPFTQSITGAVERPLIDKGYECPSVKDFGAVGDGVTDDTAALQAALDSNRVVILPPGKYRTTATLLIDPIRNRGNGFVGTSTFPTRYPYTTQTGGPAWTTGQGEAIIFYDGTTSATAAVIAASAEPVGVEPASTFNTTVWGVMLHNIQLDANNKAGFGFYGARVQEVQFEHLYCRGATVAGCSLSGTYSGSINRMRCYLNPGRGFEIGAADARWGWTTNDLVNALYIYDLHTFINGSDSTFRETDPVLRTNNCGFYFGPHRGVFVYGMVSELNFGANVVFISSGVGNYIYGLYTEQGCEWEANGAGTDAISLGYATLPYGLIFSGDAGGASLNCGLVGGMLAGDYIWLTGTEPTAAREESGFLIADIGLAGGTKADWGNYKIRDCHTSVMTVTGTEPVGAHTLKGGIQFGAGLDILANYDKGTWVPTLQGATIAGTGWAYNAATSGSYTRTGDGWLFNGTIILTTKSTDATGQIQIASLPFTFPNSNNIQGCVSVECSIMTTSIVSCSGSPVLNASKIGLQVRTAAAVSPTSMSLANLSDTTVIRFSGSATI